MRVSDRLFGPIFILLGLALALYGYGLPPMPGQAYGAGLFPLVVGAFMSLGGALLALGGWRRRHKEPLIALAEWARNRSDLANLVLVFACVMAFGLLIREIGFAVLTAVTATLLLVRFGQSWWRAVVAGVIAAAALQYLFASLMRVPLPPGLLQGFIY